VLAGLLLSGCDGGFDPAELGAVRFTPPPSYREMWARAEECTGREGDFDGITWWVVPGVETFDYEAGAPDANGFYDGDTHAITLAGSALAHPMVVRHEMLHALGFGAEHPDPPFRAPCRATQGSWDAGEPFLELPKHLTNYMP
jgi:hypothetical protein